MVTSADAGTARRTGTPAGPLLTTLTAVRVGTRRLVGAVRPPDSAEHTGEHALWRGGSATQAGAASDASPSELGQLPAGRADAPVVLVIVGLVALLVAVVVIGAGDGGGLGWMALGLCLSAATVAVAAGALAVVGRLRPALRGCRGRDELTGLLGRRAFLDVAARSLGGGEHRAREVNPAALLLVDLDRFREINEVLGHDHGDRLLVVVGRRLRAALRPQDTVARIGGDEFAVLLRDTDRERAERVAGRLRAAVRGVVQLADTPVQTEASVGIAHAPAHGRGVSELLRHAEEAMSKAKRTRAGQCVYDVDCRPPAGRARLRLRGELRGALERDQIELRYQPKADLRTGKINGVEALVRWMHPTEGLRGPELFLAEMEQAGLMPQLTRRVLDLALADCAGWHAAGAALTVSINVPPTVLGEAGFVDVVRGALVRHGLPAAALVVEITEEGLITVRDQASATLAALRAHGVQVSLDDYGTGFCSLAYLRELPADEVKLDQRFLRDMDRDASAAEIVRSTVSLAHALDLRIVAEGVQSKASWQSLAAWHCDEVQGYFVSRPLTGGRVLGWLADWGRRISRNPETAGVLIDARPAGAVRPARPGRPDIRVEMCRTPQGESGRGAPPVARIPVPAARTTGTAGRSAVHRSRLGRQVC
jgi:diguanylate cyclase (GGDEF)-like protein